MNKNNQVTTEQYAAAIYAVDKNGNLWSKFGNHWPIFHRNICICWVINHKGSNNIFQIKVKTMYIYIKLDTNNLIIYLFSHVPMLWCSQWRQVHYHNCIAGFVSSSKQVVYHFPVSHDHNTMLWLQRFCCVHCRKLVGNNLINMALWKLCGVIICAGFAKTIFG